MRSNKYIPRLYNNGAPVQRNNQDPYDRYYQEKYGNEPAYRRPAYGPPAGEGTRGNREIYIDREGNKRYGGGYLVGDTYYPDKSSMMASPVSPEEIDREMARREEYMSQLDAARLSNDPYLLSEEDWGGDRLKRGYHRQLARFAKLDPVGFRESTKSGDFAENYTNGNLYDPKYSDEHNVGRIGGPNKAYDPGNSTYLGFSDPSKLGEDPHPEGRVLKERRYSREIRNPQAQQQAQQQQQQTQQPTMSQRMMEDVMSRNPQQAQQQQAQNQQTQNPQQTQPSNTKARFEAAFKEARDNGETEFPFDRGNGTSMYSTRYEEETPEQHAQNMRKSKTSQTSLTGADGSVLIEDRQGVKRLYKDGRVVLLAAKNDEGVMTPTEAGRQDSGFMGTAQLSRNPRQNTEPLFNDPSGSFPQNNPELSTGIPGRKINPVTKKPFTNQELMRSQQIAQQMNYIGDPNALMSAVQSGEVDPSQLSKYGYRNIADLREEVRSRDERANMSETEKELMDYPGNQGYLREDDERKLAQTGIKDLDKAIGDISTRFEAGNITEGVRGIVQKGLTSQRGDKLNGFRSMGEDQLNRVKNRLSRRGQRDQASAAVLNILDGRMDDVEGMIEALEGSKFDITDMNGLELIDSTSGVRIDGSKQYVEDVFSGPGFTLTVTDDFVVGVVNGKEVKISRG